MRLLFVSLLLAVGPVLAQDDSSPVKKNVVWQDDPVCQFVFFAVLEGLYQDGIQDEVVDLVIGKSGDQDPNVKRSFVFQCELCHATFEAFVLYRQRQTFNNSEGKTTFGPGVSESIVENLRSPTTRNRVYAMGSLIRPWIQRRIEAQRLTRDELIELHDRIAEYAEEGKRLLSNHRASGDAVYVDWNFYGSCQACEATQDIATKLKDMKDE